jgi:hypothetical protein
MDIIFTVYLNAEEMQVVQLALMSYKPSQITKRITVTGLQGYLQRVVEETVVKHRRQQIAQAELLNR